jgi:phosphoribosylanthranilate isomerase
MAARVGADAIGMVFHPPSPRNVSMEQAEAILSTLPPFVTPVGLFVDAAPAAVMEIVRRLGLRHVQLNGRETPETVAEIRAIVIKAVRVDPQSFGTELATWLEARGRLGLSHLHGLVLETAGTQAPGGTGIANDWATVKRLRDQGAFDGLPPLIAAGGLTPDSVADVVRDIRPWAVDVSSGVELIRGQKSEELVRAFVAAVREADRANQER